MYLVVILVAKTSSRVYIQNSFIDSAWELSNNDVLCSFSDSFVFYTTKKYHLTDIIIEKEKVIIMFPLWHVYYVKRH